MLTALKCRKVLIKVLEIVPIFILYSIVKYMWKDDAEISIIQSNHVNKSWKFLEQCAKLSEIAFDPEVKCDKAYKCIRLSRYGRFGNQFWTVVRGLKIAEFYGFKIVRIDKGKAFINTSLNYHGIDLVVEDPYDPPDYPCYEVNSYWGLDGFKYINLTIDDDMLELFLRNIQPKDYPDDALVMYMRGGDIFAKRPPRDYGQPFCNYYLDVMKAKPWSKVLLFAQDHRNPCVDIAIANGAIEQDAKSFEDVVNAMAGARNLVTPRGSLGPTFAALARHLKTLYTFNMSTAQFKAEEHDNCVPTDDFYSGVISDWRGTKRQYKSMAESGCLRWEKLGYNPGEDRKIFVHSVAI